MSRIKVLFSVGVFVLLQLSVGGGFAEPIRIAMPSKSLTFLNYYLAEKFGLFNPDSAVENSRRLTDGRKRI